MHDNSGINLRNSYWTFSHNHTFHADTTIHTTSFWVRHATNKQTCSLNYAWTAIPSTGRSRRGDSICRFGRACCRRVWPFAPTSGHCVLSRLCWVLSRLCWVLSRLCRVLSRLRLRAGIRRHVHGRRTVGHRVVVLCPPWCRSPLLVFLQFHIVFRLTLPTWPRGML